MAITGTLIADFSSFYDGAAKAEAAMGGMSAAAVKTGKALGAMVDTVDTAPAVADLKKLDKAVDDVAVTASKTAAPALDKMSAAGTTSGGGIKSLQENLLSVDKVLAAVGISLGPLPGALGELSAASGLAGAAGSLGLLATAALGVASAVGGWKVGRWIADFSGSDKIIGDAAANLLGWRDAGQEAAAAQDVLAKASAIAGYQITSMTSAVRIITAAEKDRFDGVVAGNKEAEKAAASAAKEAEKFAGFVEKLFSRDDIARADDYVKALGGVENVTQLTTDKKKELHKAVSDAIAAYEALGERAPGALRAIQRATTELIPVVTSFASTSSGAWAEFRTQAQAGGETIAQVTERAKTDWTDLGGVSREMLIQMATEAVEKYDVAMAASENFTGKQIADFRRAKDEALAAVDAWGTDTLEAYDAIQAASTAAASTQIANNARVVASTVSSWTEAMSAVAAGQGTMTGTVSGVDTSPANRTAIQRAWDEGQYFGPVTGGTAQNPRGTGPTWAALGFRAAGGAVAAGLPYVVGERGPELMVPSSAGRVVPSGGYGGVVVNISTVMGDPQAIARLVSQALVDTARARGARLPAGA